MTVLNYLAWSSAAALQMQMPLGPQFGGLGHPTLTQSPLPTQTQTESEPRLSVGVAIVETTGTVTNAVVARALIALRLELPS